MTIQQFIKKRPYLVWYTNNYKELSEDAILEATLNYGEWEDVQAVFGIMGLKKAAKIFKDQISKKRSNYHPQTKNFFKLYFKEYA